MKNNKLMKLLLSLLITLTITYTSADTISQTTIIHHDSQIQLYGEEPEETPFDKHTQP